MSLQTAVREAFSRGRLLLPGEKVLVGFSGGPDSLALLHALRHLRDELQITVLAAHLNHMLRGEDALADEAFAIEICTAWGIPLTVERQDVYALTKEWSLAVEEAARRARYLFLARTAENTGAAAVAVAHNADDQVETVLMHFLRGSGLAGLRGMLPSVKLADLRLGMDVHINRDLKLIRPLLDVPRVAIENYCREQGLSPRFDRSNLDTTYYRNRLRHELIPTLANYNPNIRAVIRRTSDLFATDYDYLRQQREAAWAETVLPSPSGSVVLSLQMFRVLHLSLQRALLRRAIACLRPGLRNINWVHVEQALQILMSAEGAGVQATLPSGLMLTIGYDCFAVAESSLSDPFGGCYPQMPIEYDIIPLSVPGCIMLPGGWKLYLRQIIRHQLPDNTFNERHHWTAYLDAAAAGAALSLRCRRSGERLQPLGLGGHGKKLGELMINWRIPLAFRQRYPVLAGVEYALWLPGYQIDERARVRETTEQVLVATMRQELNGGRDSGCEE